MLMVLTLAGCQPLPSLADAHDVRTPHFALTPVRTLSEAAPPDAATPVTSAGQPAASPSGGPTGGTSVGAAPLPGAGPTPPPATPRPGSGGGSGGSGAAPGEPTPPPTDAPPPPTIPPAPPQPADCAPCASGVRTGVVLAAEAPHGPLAGVVVRAGTTTAMTAADGSFALPAPADAGELVTFSASGRATSAVAGFREGALTSHLARATTAIAGGTGGGTSFYTVTGRVLAPDGAPAAGVDLVVTGADGVSAGPAVSAADGRFTMRVFGAPAGAATTAGTWAYRLDDAGDVTALGLAATPLAPGADLGDIRLAEAGGEVALARPVTWSFFGTLGWELAVTTASGASFVLSRRAAGQLTAPRFALPGATLEARAWAHGDDGQTAAFWRQEVGADPLEPTLPAPPVPEAALGVAPGSEWRWRPIPEVDGYRVQIERVGGEGAFEAFTHLPRLTLPAEVPAGPARLRIVAAREGGLRAVASLPAGPARPRALRLFGSPTMYAVWQGEAP